MDRMRTDRWSIAVWVVFSPHMGRVQVTVKDRILLHLLEYWGLPDRGEWPPAITQTGIASAVRVSRGHVAVELPTLVGWGLVESRVARVSGRPRRVKAYFLTYRGGEVAGRLAAGLLQNTVTARDGTGEWDMPIDGLIQVHKVDLLTALASIDGRGRVDLRQLTAPLTPEAFEVAQDEATPAELGFVEGAGHAPAPSPVMAADASTAVGPAEVVPPRAPTGPSEPSRPAPGARYAPPSPLPPSPPPPSAPPPSAPPPSAPQPVPVAMVPPPTRPMLADAPPQAAMFQTQMPPPAYYWNPIRMGSGRRPRPLSLAVMLGTGFGLLVAAAFFFGMGASTEAPEVCVILGGPLLIFGTLLTWLGGRGLWALGGRRKVWVSTALCAHAFLIVVVVSMFLFDVPALLDMLWVAAILGVPSLVLAAGANRAVRRRGTLLLFLGPIVAVVFAGTGLLETDWARTPAMAMLGIEVGASWAFVGALMLEQHGGGVRRGAVAVEGLAAGLALLGVAWVLDDIDRGQATAGRTALVAMWVATAAWVVLARYAPAVRRRTPPLGAAYPVLATAAAAGLLVAAGLFLVARLSLLGLMVGLIAVAMVGMSAPELRAGGRVVWGATAWACLVAAVSVVVLTAEL